MDNTAVINVNTDPKTKDEAEQLFAKFGITVSDAVNIFLNKSLMEKGFPFDIKMSGNIVITENTDIEDSEHKFKEIPIANTCQIEWSGEKFLKVGGSPKKFTAIFYDAEGEKYQPNAKWKLILSEEQGGKVKIVEETLEFIRIKVEPGDSLIETNFTLCLTDKNETEFYKTEIIIEIVQLF